MVFGTEIEFSVAMVFLRLEYKITCEATRNGVNNIFIRNDAIATSVIIITESNVFKTIERGVCIK
ncbi:MAG: hypothetical protein A2725_01565 [Candidatus Magasanikbacteria bacterium RIFCSPHIGHO2_01_FULL_33_34]|uniref:Uncharacterized protein n=1 Tax=Candidatus Magasanikbacteria bacterium RIFCSPHIGHO2_01_FULL_33_34 TaxID=1798671 RepID=A0A1F6LJB0_9BACT|nr:MAG: hypothetical protein A2725_01565 [Candidatus Magasanikbacteria bacterium RIFCSPHIGHO2_01_FULL_33_34]OGH65501.1 MAG: hypothetical protein A3B83_01320 [Candidatus Magasanikbacteria bacterium RIFCSPHIGHO2_02_FULL_33_17]OGH76211.1 MAG: hypothetical protein A3A89_02140 [Candidatus Magasanikbacteria bacterium RIFCSPLOWO2_01_FULL_33_34]